MAVTGTPDQLPKLINSAENGLLTRNIIYVFESDGGFDSVAPKSNGSIKSHFEDLADDIYKIYNKHKDKCYMFRLTPDQIEAIDSFFKEAELYIGENISGKLQGFIKRTALISFKIAMVLSILRHNINSEFEITCTDNDINIVLQLANVFLWIFR